MAALPLCRVERCKQSCLSRSASRVPAWSVPVGAQAAQFPGASTAEGKGNAAGGPSEVCLHVKLAASTQQRGLVGSASCTTQVPCLFLLFAQPVSPPVQLDVGCAHACPGYHYVRLCCTSVVILEMLARFA